MLNFASGVARPVHEVLHRLLANSRTKIDVTPDPARQRPSDLPISVGDATLARQTLSWAPRRPFEETLRDVLDYYRSLG